MTRLIPFPLLTLALFALWLLLTQSLSAGQVVLGAIVALLATHAAAVLRPEGVTVHRLRPAFRLAGVVALDIIRSNLAVARIILFRPKNRVSGFVHLPLDLTSPQGLAVLGLIITATPGTLWVDFDRRQSMLLIHMLDLVDEEEWVQLIKARYEAPLLEIFER